MVIYVVLLSVAAGIDLLITAVAAYASAVPVPEPATIVLVGAGAVAAGGAAWLKRRRGRK
jgi:threonine dehydrogenase-like Zn-dependent dehydrogenase